jgi:hypothetical protein
MVPRSVTVGGSTVTLMFSLTISPLSPTRLRWLDSCSGSSSAQSGTLRPGVYARRHGSCCVRGAVAGPLSTASSGSPAGACAARSARDRSPHPVGSAGRGRRLRLPLRFDWLAAWGTQLDDALGGILREQTLIHKLDSREVQDAPAKGDLMAEECHGDVLLDADGALGPWQRV